jgi:membrane-bound serine protease (ClpP class)
MCSLHPFLSSVTSLPPERMRRAPAPTFGPVRVGAQAMRGLSAEILDWSENEGHVFAHGERWQARGTEAFKPGEVVEVANIVDLTLVVRRAPVPTGEVGTS